VVKIELDYSITEVRVALTSREPGSSVMCCDEKREGADGMSTMSSLTPPRALLALTIQILVVTGAVCVTVKHGQGAAWAHLCSFQSRKETKVKKIFLVLSLIVMPVLGYAGFRNTQTQMEQGPIAGQDPIAAQEEPRAPRAQIPPQDRKAKLGVEGLMGFVVRAVESGSTAEETGIRPGDVITHLNGRQVYTIHDVQKLWAHSPGEQVSVQLLRIGPDGQSIKTQRVSGRLKSY